MDKIKFFLWNFFEFSTWCIFDTFTQKLLVNYLGAPKQTINSAITNLIKDDLLMIKIIDGKSSKELTLTDKGNKFLNEKILPIVKAENEAYAKFILEN